MSFQEHLSRSSKSLFNRANFAFSSSFRDTPDLAPPALPLVTTEAYRTMWEASSLFASAPLLRRAPSGDGHPVLVCPGFMTSDASTIMLRKFLDNKNYHVYGWDLGTNLGLRTTGIEGEKLAERVIQIYRKHRRKITLIGWSLGGVLSREIAKRMPDQIRQVITLGSPIAGKTEASSVGWLYHKVTGHDNTKREFKELEATIHEAPEHIPCTSIFSKGDGIVSWKTCLERKSPLTDNIEVYASHCGLGFNPSVYFAVADRLALPENEWRPFDRESSFMRRRLYPTSGHHYKLADLI